MFCEFIGKERKGLKNGYHYFVYSKIKRNKIFVLIEGLETKRGISGIYRGIETFLKDWKVEEV